MRFGVAALVVLSLLVASAAVVGEMNVPAVVGNPSARETGATRGDDPPVPMEARTWTNPYPIPAARLRTAAAYDARADRVVMFGGTADWQLADTWSYDADANRWAELSPATKPPARCCHAMAYDAQSDRVILFGGGSTALGDTWAYDPANNTWTDMAPAVHPSPRGNHGMAYDARADRVILFGGWTGSGFDGETWAYDFENNTWTNLNPAARPGGRELLAMAYDAAAERTLLFGGYSSGYLQGTYAYDFANNTWTNRNPPSQPSARFGHMMAYDAQSERTILFGGRTSSSSVVGDTWAYDYRNNTWTNMAPAVRPSARVYAAFAYDPTSDRTVLFGGGNGLPSEEHPDSETWAYDVDGNAWARRDPDPRPTARASFGMAYAPTFDRTLLFGGCAVTMCPTNETWAYDSDAHAWTNRTPVVGPSPRQIVDVAYDERSERLILFGGLLASIAAANDTWAYDYRNNSWTDMKPAQSPSPRYDYAMAYDAQSDRIVLFGGYDPLLSVVDDTWVYDYLNNTWTDMGPSTRPRAREGHAMTYDAGSDVVVMTGGMVVGGQGDDTWTYNVDSNTWSDRGPAVSPGERRGAGMAYVAAADRILLFGGGVVPMGTWAYGTASNVWAGLAAVGNPPDRGETKMVYDTQSDRVVLFGGYGFDFLEDVWWYDYGPTLPTAPRNLSAEAGNARVNLTWEPPTSGGDSWIAGYRIYRGGSSGTEVPVATIGDVLAYGDVGLTNGVTYYFLVTALTVFLAEGPPSNEVFATPVTVPTEPRNLQAAAGNARVTLTWDPPLDDGGTAVTGYGVYRGVAPGSLLPLATLGVVLTYEDTGAQNGITYYYRVHAVNRVGEGPPSAVVSARPTAPPDTTPPSVTIEVPPNGTVLHARDVEVSGTASDDVAVLHVYVSLDGSNWMRADGTTTWSASLTLAEGANTVYARATDSSGHQNTTTVSVTVQLEVTTTPGPPWGYAAVLVAVVLGGIAVALFVRRRRRKGPEEPAIRPP